MVSFEVDDGAGGWQPIDPTALYKVATNYYSASFLAAFGLTPRDKTGVPTTVANSIVYQGPNQLKCWQALTGYMGIMPDLDGDGIPNVAAVLCEVPQRQDNRRGVVPGGGLHPGRHGGHTCWCRTPTADDAHVNIVFQTGEGEVAPADLQGVTIPAGSRSTFLVNNWVSTYDVSTVVEPIDGEVVCERAMYGERRRLGHDSIGVTAPSPAPGVVPGGGLHGPGHGDLAAGAEPLPVGRAT